MTKLIVPLLLTLAALTGCVHRPPPGLFFPLGVWYEGGVGNARDNVLPEDPDAAAPIYENNFTDIASHGINVIVVPNSPPSHHRLVLDGAQRHGLKVILELGLDGGPIGAMIRGQQPMDDALIRKTFDEVVAPIKNHPALMRVQLLDEPADDAFGRYAHVADMLRQYNKRTPAFCCLTGGANGGAFLQQTKSSVVAFDFYPIAPGNKPNDPKPLAAFAECARRFADWAQQNRAACWPVVQCEEITGALRFPTPPEMRCLTYLSLATGGRGLFWFLYQTEHVSKDQLMSGLVDRDFKARPLWHEVAHLTKELRPLLPTLSRLHPDRNTGINVSAGVAYALRDSSKHLYVFVVNTDSKHPAKIEVSVPGKSVTRVDLKKVHWVAKDGAVWWREHIDPATGVLYSIR